MFGLRHILDKYSKIKAFLFAFSVCVSSLLTVGVEALSQENLLINRIKNCLLISNFEEAVEISEYANRKFLNCDELEKLLIISWARNGQEQKALNLLEPYVAKLSSADDIREIYREIAWSIIERNYDTSAITLRQICLLAASISGESRGVNLLLKGLVDTNYVVKKAAIEFSSQLPDKALQDHVLKIVETEKNREIVKASIVALGNMNAKQAVNHLKTVIAAENVPVAEQILAINSLLQILDSVDVETLQRLSQSNRFIVKLFVCQAISHFNLVNCKNILISLINDPNAMVRASALKNLGLLNIQNDDLKNVKISFSFSSDLDTEVQVTKGWFLLLHGDVEGEKILERSLLSHRKEEALLASAAIKNLGSRALNISQKWFKKHQDPFVRLNLSMHLLSQESSIKEATSELESLCLNLKDRLAPSDNSLFEHITSAHKVKSSSLDDLIIQDQLTRLGVLNLLIDNHSSRAEMILHELMQKKKWEIAFGAGLLAMSLSNDSAVEMLNKHLSDPSAKIKLKSALILSLWSRDEKPLAVLKEAYKLAPHDIKARILEAIARIGSDESLLFLKSALQEPSPTLKLIASLAIIMCVNN